MNKLASYGFQTSDLQHSSQHQHSTLAGRLLERSLDIAGISLDQLADYPEASWQEAILQACREDRLGGECLVDPLRGELPLADIDFHLKGVVRWMNELGVSTAYCCEGHGKRPPYAVLLALPTSKQKHLLRMCAPEGVLVRFQGKRVVWDTARPDQLLQMAARLYRIIDDPATLLHYEAEHFAVELVELLEVPGESGAEEPIRRVVRSKLRPLADDLFVDRAGNVCATLECGEGPTVLLSAHMDLYSELEAGRRIVRDGTQLSSTRGILGADDRAGIAVILELCRRIHRTNFNGTLKVALTVQEEVGLVGAQRLEPAFLEDVDAAIVIDRRGTRDIVTSCAGVTPFCSPAYGELFEEAGRLAGMPDWHMTPGGSSDARIYARQFGIPSVNLSAGYRYEHTEQETVDYLATYQTVKLIETVMHRQLIIPCKIQGDY